MSQEQSPKLAADLYVNYEKTLTVAALLAFAEGYLDAYSWIVHRVFANAQTANLVFLWIYGASGEWAMAFHYAPPLVSFMIGVIAAFWLRRAVGVEAGRLSMLLEIAFLSWSRFFIIDFPTLREHSAFPLSLQCGRQAFPGSRI